MEYCHVLDPFGDSHGTFDLPDEVNWDIHTWQAAFSKRLPLNSVILNITEEYEINSRAINSERAYLKIRINPHESETAIPLIATAAEKIIAKALKPSLSERAKALADRIFDQLNVRPAFDAEQALSSLKPATEALALAESLLPSALHPT